MCNTLEIHTFEHYFFDFFLFFWKREVDIKILATPSNVVYLQNYHNNEHFSFQLEDENCCNARVNYISYLPLCSGHSTYCFIQ